MEKILVLYNTGYSSQSMLICRFFWNSSWNEMALFGMFCKLLASQNICPQTIRYHQNTPESGIILPFKNAYRPLQWSSREGGCLPRGGMSALGGCLPGGCLPGGCLPRGMSVQGCVCLGGCLPIGVHSRGWGVCPGGVYLVGVSTQRGVSA